MSDRDHLTGLFSRATFDTDLEHILGEASSERPASLIMTDIDHFKRVNDTHGHPKGDSVLTEVARRLMVSTEGKGKAYRYGGEEYAVILPNHDRDEALAVAERLRSTIERELIDGLRITSSFGVSDVNSKATTIKQWLSNSDEALYSAKQLGRNLVRFHGEPQPSVPESSKPIRKQAIPGGLSANERERMRMEILKLGGVNCPKDDVPLNIFDITGVGESTKSFAVYCPGCGFEVDLEGPERPNAG